MASGTMAVMPIVMNVTLMLWTLWQGAIRETGRCGPHPSRSYAAAQSESNVVDELVATCHRHGGTHIGIVYYGQTFCERDGKADPVVFTCETTAATSCFFD